MTLDPSIPLRAVQGMYNPAETIQQGLSLKSLMAEQQAQQASAELKQRELGMREQEFAWKQREQEREAERAGWEEIGAAAQWADTPEKWDRAVGLLAQQDPEVAQFRGRFDQREMVIAKAGKMKEFLSREDDLREQRAAQEDRDADNRRQEMSLREVMRHNRTQEGVSAGNLSVRQGALGLARQRVGQGAKGATGGGGGMSHLSDNDILGALLGGD